MVQDPKHANPPSLFLPVMAMARQLQAAGGDDGQADKEVGDWERGRGEGASKERKRDDGEAGEEVNGGSCAALQGGI